MFSGMEMVKPQERGNAAREGCLNNRGLSQSSKQYGRGILNIWEGETLSESLLNLPYALSDPLNPAWSVFS